MALYLDDPQLAHDTLHAEHQALQRRFEEQSLELGRLRDLLDAAPDALLVIESDGRIAYVSVQAEKLFGYERAELIGQHLELLIPGRFRRHHAEYVAKFMAQAGARPMGSGLELWARRKDGSEVAIEVSLSPLRTKRGTTVSAAIRDISERKRAEASAKLAAERLASAVESIEDAFALFDRDDRLVLCNSIYRRLFGDSLPGPIAGTSYEKLLDAWMTEIAFPDDAARARFRSERLARRRRDHAMTFELSMRDGRTLRVVDRRTAEGGIVKTISDVTEDVHLADALREARVAADAANGAKSEFLSSMSHELRTPLNAILGFAQLLRRDKKDQLSDRNRERVAHILNGGAHLLRLIDDILDLSRIEAGRVSMCIEAVSVLEVVEDVRKTLEPMAASRAIRIELEALAAQAPLAVDRTRFAQILMNFGSNAIKYNRPAGTVTFSASTPRPGHVRVSVRDNGAGIPADKQNELFQPFARAGQEAGPIEGTGLGLVITRRLAQMMSGDVGFRSVCGEGSEFWVDVPIHESHASAGVQAAVVREASSAPCVAGGHGLIVYVEDNPANVSLMKDLVSTLENVELLTAPTAEAGIELARSRQPEVVIMDINLPGLSGLDALRALRGDPETMGIPVIALTAAASERDRQHGMEAGFYRYLTKPVNVSELMMAVEGLLVPARLQG